MSIKALYPEDRPSLLCEFKNTKRLPSYITFTRSSTATYVDNLGLIKTAAINQPRFDHSTTSVGKQLGLLIEEARTNLLVRSEEFDNASWTKLGAVVTANAVTSPGGAPTGDVLREDVTTGPHEIYIPGLSGLSTAVLSLYVKANTGSRFLNLSASAGASNYVSVRFSPSTGQLSAVTTLGTFSNASAVVTSLADGWYRVALSFSVSSGTMAAQLALSTELNPTLGNFGLESYTGDDSSSISIWGAQLEVGTFPTSYIPTTSDTVTRSADNCTITGTNFSRWYRQDEGTFLATSINAGPVPSAGFPRIISVGDGTANNRLETFRYGSGIPRISVATAGVVQAAFDNTPSVASGVPLKFCTAYKTDDIAISANGNSITTDTSATIPTCSGVMLGDYLAQPGIVGQGYMGPISSVLYWPQRLSNTVIQNLSKR